MAAAAMASRGSTAALSSLVLLVLVLVMAFSALPASLAVTSPYVRPPARATLPLLLQDDDDADGQTPQQVHAPPHILPFAIGH
jgi:hypothetical protein